MQARHEIPLAAARSSLLHPPPPPPASSRSLPQPLSSRTCNERPNTAFNAPSLYRLQAVALTKAAASAPR
eukprot:124088-Chlamydomonas_euryale.AAC.3